MLGCSFISALTMVLCVPSECTPGLVPKLEIVGTEHVFLLQKEGKFEIGCYIFECVCLFEEGIVK